MRVFSPTVILIVVIFQLVGITVGFGMEPPQQGTIIPCEECVVLYPKKYEDDPKSCPICNGQKEHFQPARMMVGKLVDVQAYELELKIENFLLKAVISAHKKPISIEVLKEIRSLYREKLIFHLIYSKFEREPIKAYILELDELIGKTSDETLDIKKGASL